MIVDVQRAGPSTGMPTKTEQADLNMALFGRHGEAPVAVVAPRSPSDCFHAAIEAARIALTYRTPVILLSDNYVANGSEPWLLPDVADLPDLRVEFATEPNGEDGTVPAVPARPGDAGPAVGDPRHARPGAPHRRPGEGRQDRRHLLRPGQPRLHGAHPGRPHRGDRGARRRGRGPGRRRAGCSCSGWGSTYGPIGAACRALRQRGLPIAQAHLRHLTPMPAQPRRGARGATTGWSSRR